MRRVEKARIVGRYTQTVQHFLLCSQLSGIVEIDAEDDRKGNSGLFPAFFLSSNLMLTFLIDQNITQSVTKVLNGNIRHVYGSARSDGDKPTNDPGSIIALRFLHHIPIPQVEIPTDTTKKRRSPIPYKTE